MKAVELTLLVDNTVRGSGLLAEHGLAWWIDTGSHRVLFDTGQGRVLGHNAQLLGIDLSQADAIVLSHGHYDHVLGLPEALEAAPDALLCLHPGALGRRYGVGPDGAPRRLSTDFMEAGEFGAGRTILRVDRPTEVVPGIWVSGEIPRRHDWEDVGGRFFLDEGLSCPDSIVDDMSIYLTQGQRLSVIFGCAHAGMVNTMEHVLAATECTEMDLLAGGLHLCNASASRISKTIETLKHWRPQRMRFCHCTGAQAVHQIWEEFPEACAEAHVGMRLSCAP